MSVWTAAQLNCCCCIFHFLRSRSSTPICSRACLACRTCCYIPCFFLFLSWNQPGDVSSRSPFWTRVNHCGSQSVAAVAGIHSFWILCKYLFIFFSGRTCRASTVRRENVDTLPSQTQILHNIKLHWVLSWQDLTYVLLIHLFIWHICQQTFWSVIFCATTPN